MIFPQQAISSIMDAFDQDYFSDEFEEPFADFTPKENKPVNPAPVALSPVSKTTEQPVDEQQVVDEPMPGTTAVVEDCQPLNAPDGVRRCIAINCAGGRLYLPEREVSLPSATQSSVLLKPFSVLEAEARESHDRLTAKKLQALESPTLECRKFGSGQAWVDKYAPRKFTDLLSAADINLKVLQWLNDWKKKIALRSQLGADAPPDAETFKHLLLIGGSPGVGKSVMVNICAKQAGYNLVETNASEERGKADFLKLINGVCQNLSVVEADKPRILLFEEIDGADKSALEAVVDALHKKDKLLRPIICICNDLWSRQLKPLREEAQVLVVNPPRGLRLQDRIKEVCKLEGVEIQSLAVGKLVEACECDIRSTLNQLQALAAVGQGVISPHDVFKGLHGALRGEGAIKDSERNEGELLEKIFLPKRLRTQMHASDIIATVIPGCRNISTFPQLLAHCLTTVPFTDSNFTSSARVCELLAINDVIRGDLALPILAATSSCMAVGQLRLDLPEARKISRARFQASSDKTAVLRALIPLGLNFGKSFHTAVAPLLIFCLGIPGSPAWAQEPGKKHWPLEKLVSIMLECEIGLQAKEGGGYELHPNLELVTLGFQGWKGKSEVLAEFKPFWLEVLPIVEAVDRKYKHLLKGDLVEKLPMATPAKKRSSVGVAGAAKRFRKDDEAKMINVAEWCGAKRPDNSPERQAKEQKKYDAFEFHYQEGHSNAVKRVVLVSEFLCN